MNSANSIKQARSKIAWYGCEKIKSNMHPRGRSDYLIGTEMRVELRPSILKTLMVMRSKSCNFPKEKAMKNGDDWRMKTPAGCS